MRRFPLLAALLLAALPTHAADDGARFTSIAGLPLAADVTLADVLKQFGAAPIVEYGESGAYRASICYVADDALVAFLSEELGGPDHRLLGYSVMELSAKERARCAQPSRRLNEAQIVAGGLRLGMSRDEFSARLRPPIEWRGNVGRHIYPSQEPLTGAEAADFEFAHAGANAPIFWNVTVSVFGTFQGDRLTSIEVWKIRLP